MSAEELRKLMEAVKPGMITAEPHGKHTALYAGRSRKMPSPSHGYRLCNIDDEDPGVIALIVAAVNALPEHLALKERVAELEAVLQPFVYALDKFIHDDDADTMKPAIVQTGHFRAARAALKGTAT